MFGICETFLNQTVEDKILKITGYQFERKDRENCTTSDKTHGGGIIIYIAEHINYIRRYDLESADIESVWLEVCVPNSKSFLICSVYRPPSAKAEWIESFSKQIDNSSSKCAEIYIMGDINIDMKNGSLLNNTWKQQIELHDFTQLVKEPTRITAHSEKIIDHIYASDSSKVSEVFVPSIAISDHYPICFTRTVSKAHKKRHSHINIQYRCFRKFDNDAFLSDLSTSLNRFHYTNNIDNNFSMWTESFTSVLDKHAPNKTKRVKRQTQPEWFNNDIKEASKKRDIYHKQKNWKQYKYWRNKTNSLIKDSKKKVFSDAIQEQKASNVLWKHVKQIGNAPESSGIPEELIVDDNKYNSPAAIANELNKYFATISERLKSTRETSSTAENCDFQKLHNFVNARVPENINFKIPLINIPSLTEALKSLDTSKATGLDCLSPRILKISAEVVAPSLSKIINQSITESQFPSILKVAKLFPVHKNGPKHDPSNYRPI